MEARGDVRSHPCQPEECQDGDGRDQSGGDVGPEAGDVGDGFTEADGIEGYGHRLGKEQHEADGTPELHAERAGDHVIVATALDIDVGGYGGEGNAGQNRNGRGYADDEQRHPQPRASDDEAEAQEENDSENREDGRDEHPGKGAEGACGTGLRRARVVGATAHDKPRIGSAFLQALRPRRDKPPYPRELRSMRRSAV